MRAHRFLAVTLRPLILVLALAGTARAQQMAQPPGPPAPERVHHHHGHGGAIGGHLSLARPGRFDGSAGWLGRLEYELLFISESSGAVIGMTGGIEYWRDRPDQGFAMPLGFVLGARVFPMRGTIGFGITAISIAEIADDAGIGVGSPYAGASLGFDVRGVRVFAETRIARHWQLGADDFTQWQLGIGLGYTLGLSGPRAGM